MRPEVVVIGGGPAGATTAMLLARSGIRTVLVERSKFPRFHIGESLTGEAGNLLRSIGLEKRMEANEHPVKHGVEVFGAQGRNGFYVPVMARGPEGLLPATSWQVRRSTFDSTLMEAALEAGVERVEGEATAPVAEEGHRIEGVKVRGPAGEEEIACDVLVDASGLGGFLVKHGVTGPKARGKYDKQIAVFTHVRGARRGEGAKRDDTVIFYQRRDHWAWFIPLDPEIVSVGVVVPSAYYRASGASMEQFLRDEISTLNPQLHSRAEGVDFVMEPRAISNYSYQIREFTGPNWLCVGDAHRFIDPVFSFGVHFALHEARKAAGAIVDFLGSDRSTPDPFAEFRTWAERGQDVIQDLLDCFWEQPLPFAHLVHQRHTEDLVDLFAGRIYDIDEPSAGLQAIRRLNAQQTSSVAAS